MQLTQALQQSRVVMSRVDNVSAVVVKHAPGSPHHEAGHRYGVAVTVIDDDGSRASQAHHCKTFWMVGVMLADTGVRFKDWVPLNERLWDALEARQARPVAVVEAVALPLAA